MQRHEVLSGDVRRRRWPRELKEEIVLETLVEGTAVTEVARRRGIDRSLIYRWRREMRVSRRGAGEWFVPVQLADATPPAAAVHDDRPTDSADDRCHEDATPGGGMGRVMCLFSKRLEKGRFVWPSADGRVVITPAQLAMLLEGIDWRMPRRTWRPSSAG